MLKDVFNKIKARIQAFRDWADEAEDECSGRDVMPDWESFEYRRIPREGKGHFALIRVKKGCQLCDVRMENHAKHQGEVLK